MSTFKFKGLNMHFKHEVRRDWPFWAVWLSIGFGSPENALWRRLDGLHVTKGGAERRAAALSNEITVSATGTGADVEVLP